MKLLMLWVFAVLAFVFPASAMASGMYLPWYAEAAFYLVGTPQGLAILAVLVTLIVVGIVHWAKKRKR